MEAMVGERGMKNDGKEAEPFLSLAAALDGSQAWLGSWEPWRECWALERLGVWVTGGHQGAGGEGRRKLGFWSQQCLSVTLLELRGLYFCL